MNAFAERALADQAMRMKTDDRIRMYDTLVKTKPENFHYQNLLAATYVQKVRETTDFSYLDRASAVLGNVLSQDGSNYEALRLRTEVELERHNFKKAAEYSKQLTAIAPQDSWNWGTLGDAYIELGNYDGAADAYQHMVTLRPDLSSYNRAAWFRFVAGDHRGAVEIMKQAVASGSKSAENVAWCLVELGKLHEKAGQYEEAGTAYANALKTFANYHPAYAGLGSVASAIGRLDEAIAHYRKAQSSTPLPDYASALHDLYLATGNKAEAAKQMQLIEVSDRMMNDKANRNLAIIFADHDRNLERALSLARAELDIRGDIYTQDALAWALFKNGEFAAAEQASQKALKLGTPEPVLYFHAGMIAKALGKNEQAAKYLNQALHLNPRFDWRQTANIQKTLKELL